MIGDNVRYYRKIANLTQRQLAEKIGKTPGFISMLETGKSTASDVTLKSISNALQIPLNQLEEEKSTDPVSNLIETLTDLTLADELHWSTGDENPIQPKNDEIIERYISNGLSTTYVYERYNDIAYGEDDEPYPIIPSELFYLKRETLVSIAKQEDVIFSEYSELYRLRSAIISQLQENTEIYQLLLEAKDKLNNDND